MYNFKKSHTTVISVMVFILSIFVLTLPIIGQTADLQDAWQSNETTFANTSETNETFIETSPKKTQDKLEPVDQIMHEADLLARSSRPISSLSIDTNDELPEIEPDLEHDPQFNLLNS